MTTKKGTAVAVADYTEYEGQGLENVDGSHLKIPFLMLLQDMNDETKKKHAKYVKGAEPGMFMNSVTKELYPEGVTFIPACVDHCFIEWRPNRGGFAGYHKIDSDVVKQAQLEAPGSLDLRVKRTDDEGNVSNNELVETFALAGAIVNEDGSFQPIVLSNTITKIKKYKEWMTRVDMFTIPRPNGQGKMKPPLFAHKVRITSVDDKNAKGQEFANIQIQPATDNDIEKSLIPPADLGFLEGKRVRGLLGTGEASVDYESTTGEAKPENDDDTF